MKMLFEISACMESLQMQQTGFLTQPFFMKQKNVECTKSASICLLRRCCIVVCSFYAHVALSSEREKVQRKCAVFFGAHTLSHVIEYSSYCALFSEQHHFHWMFTSYVINKIIILQLNFTLERWIVAIRRISRTRHLKLSAWRSRNLNDSCDLRNIGEWKSLASNKKVSRWAISSSKLDLISNFRYMWRR